MEKSVSMIIRGRVQGVNFRYYTREAALRHNIKGFVKNLPDGSVLVEAQGEKPALDSFIAWCHNGPSQAAVDQVEVDTIDARDYHSFDIRY